MELEIPGSIVDAHAHLFTRRCFEVLARQMGDRLPKGQELETMQEITGVEIPDEDPAALATRWTLQMDRHGIAQMVVIASVPGDQASVLEAHRLHPERLIPYAMFNPREPGAVPALKEAASLGLAGVCLFPAMHQFSVDDDPALELIAAAARSALVVFVHFGLLRVAIRDKLGLHSPFDLRYGNPIALCKAAQLHPRTPFVIPHLGCGFFREVLLLSRQCPNMLLDTSSSNSWVGTQPGRPSLEDVFAQALDVVGPTRLLYGSDSTTFPRGYRIDILEQQIAIFRDLGIAPSEEVQVFGGNQIRILGRSAGPNHS